MQLKAAKIRENIAIFYFLLDKFNYLNATIIADFLQSLFYNLIIAIPNI
jgi:hypothetical protein